MTIVAREDLMAFLQAKSIRRIRIGEAVYYSLIQSEKAAQKTHYLAPKGKVCGKSLDGFTEQIQIMPAKKAIVHE
jgi:hypothetical protein